MASGVMRSSSTVTGSWPASTTTRSNSSRATATTGPTSCPDRPRHWAALHLESAWLDGEMVVVDEEGVPDFQALQNAFEAGRSSHIVYYLFDLPYLNGVDLREVPVEERRAALATVLKAGDHPLAAFLRRL